MQISYHPIGVIQTPYQEIGNMPIQPAGAQGVRGRIILEKEFVSALQDLDGFSHLILLYHFHQVQESDLTVIPFLDGQPHGVFATRAPRRPNPIGLSVVKLVVVKQHILEIENVDMLDGTPLLDIKPYIPAFDGSITDLRVGWLEGRKDEVKSTRSDDRFQS